MYKCMHYELEAAYLHFKTITQKTHPQLQMSKAEQMSYKEKIILSVRINLRLITIYIKSKQIRKNSVTSGNHLKYK